MSTYAAAPSESGYVPAAGAHHPESFLALAIGAIGVVFGDIGTSPLYAFREALAQVSSQSVSSADILGVLSLALWALILVVTVKYVFFLMRADNDGEGGVLALMALAQRVVGSRSRIIFLLGAVGGALFFGDAIITPSLSVLAAVEGLNTVPALAHVVTHKVILMLSVAILVGLFAIQSRGTASVARLFGPICLVWFIVLAGLGIWHIMDEPAVFLAFLPVYAVTFLLSHGVVGLFVLGAVFLTVTGAEALIADMGHFGKRPIQYGWLFFVFPCLTLNYLGQGAFALNELEIAQATGRAFVNKDWFFLMAPEAWRVPLVVLAGLATIIASQAVITGAYSVTQQAIQLGLLPRMTIRPTSAKQAGQIYLPLINFLLLFGVLILVFIFQSSSAMAAAYGIAVTGTMVTTTALAFVIVWRMWRWKLAYAALFIAPFLTIDLIFFGANILRVVEGGWVPLLVATVLAVVMFTWARGRRLLSEFIQRESLSLEEVAVMLRNRPPERVPGAAVFLTSNPSAAPSALLHNLKHNKVLHEKNFITTVVTERQPHLDDAQRVHCDRIDDNFTRVTLHYGFMETPDLPHDLIRAPELAKAADPMNTSYFMGKHSWVPTRHSGMPLWQDVLFRFLMRNSADPSAFYQIPPNRAVQLGALVAV